MVACVQGLGFRFEGLEFRVQSSLFRVQGFGVRARGAGCRVQGSGFRVQYLNGSIVSTSRVLFTPSMLSIRRESE